MNLNKIIEDALYVVSDKLGNTNPNLNNPYHMVLIKEELSFDYVLENKVGDQYLITVNANGVITTVTTCP